MSGSDRISQGRDVGVQLSSHGMGCVLERFACCVALTGLSVLLTLEAYETLMIQPYREIMYMYH